MTTTTTNRSLLSRLLGIFRRSARADAIPALLAAAKANGEDDRVRLRLADALLAEGDDNEALLWYWDAARINIRNENYPRAIALLSRVLTIDLECVRALVDLARCHEALDHLTDAARCFTMAAQLRARDGYADEAFGLRRRAEDLRDRGDVALEAMRNGDLEATIPYEGGEVQKLMIEAVRTAVDLHAEGLICRFPFEAVPTA